MTGINTTLLWGGGALALVAGLMLWPGRKPVPEVLDNIYCAAEAVALSQYAHTRQSAGDPLDPALSDRVSAHTKQANDYLRGLRRRDDPHIAEIRPTIASTEQQRDAAVASNIEFYLSDTIRRLDLCVPGLSGVSST